MFTAVSKALYKERRTSLILSRTTLLITKSCSFDFCGSISIKAIQASIPAEIPASTQTPDNRSSVYHK